MTLQAGGYVTDVPYVRLFTRALAPAWLDHVALVSGFHPPTRDDGFAWCDLGCGQGVTAAILAATHPAGRFHGIDAMPAHIGHARSFAAECAIENLDFHAADFAGAAGIDFVGFDYIVAHGVYSWVDRRVQADLRRFIDRNLKPGGLVYVSYYAMPGRAADLPLQRLVRALGRTLPGDSATACAAAIEIVNSFTALKAPALVGSPMAVWLKEHPEQHSASYFSHEFMVENWDPLCVTDVRAEMRAIELEPVGSAALIENYDSLVLGRASREALGAIADEDARELARDFLVDQFFRRDVFVRKGRRLAEEERRSRLLDTTFLLVQPATIVEYSMSTPAGRVKYDNAAARGIVAALAAGPRMLTDIVAMTSISAQDILANALVLSAAGALQPVESGRASVEGLNQAICRRLGGPEEILHLVLPCGTTLPINEPLRRIIVSDEEIVGQGEVGEWREFLLPHGLGGAARHQRQDESRIPSDHDGENAPRRIHPAAGTEDRRKLADPLRP
jgi:SAM-dependent methyltransferase